MPQWKNHGNVWCGHSRVSVWHIRSYQPENFNIANRKTAINQQQQQINYFLMRKTLQKRWAITMRRHTSATMCHRWNWLCAKRINWSAKSWSCTRSVSPAKSYKLPSMSFWRLLVAWRHMASTRIRWKTTEARSCIWASIIRASIRLHRANGHNIFDGRKYIKSIMRERCSSPIWAIRIARVGSRWVHTCRIDDDLLMKTCHSMLIYISVVIRKSIQSASNVQREPVAVMCGDAPSNKCCSSRKFDEYCQHWCSVTTTLRVLYDIPFFPG